MLIDDLAVSADQGKKLCADRRQGESGGYRRLSWDKWSMDSASLHRVLPGEKIILRLVRPGMTVCATSGADAAECDQQTDRDID